jgi:hypothetical protein
MFKIKMNLTNPSLPSSKLDINFSTSKNYEPYTSKETYGTVSFGYSSARSTSLIGMNISNLKASRGCSSCGK